MLLKLFVASHIAKLRLIEVSIALPAVGFLYCSVLVCCGGLAVVAQPAVRNFFVLNGR